MSILGKHHNLLAGLFCLIVWIVVPASTISGVCMFFAGLNIGLWLMQESRRGA